MKVVRFNRGQLDKLSDIVSYVALVALASVVLPALLDKIDLLRVALGLLAAIFLWIVSLWFKR